MTKKILFEQLPPELFTLFETMTNEIKELRRMIEEGEIGLAISEAEFNLVLGRITKLEEDMVSVKERLDNMGVTPEEIQNLLTSLTTVDEKISSLESYDKNSTQAFTAVMNRISTIEMNHLRLGASELTIPVTLTDNIVLPLQDDYANEIAWVSSDEDYITSDGVITRPSAFSGNKQVVLTAIFTAGANSIEKVFTITVKALDYTDDEKLTMALQDFNETIFVGTMNELSMIAVVENQVLPNELGEASITWTSSNEAAISTDGTVTRSNDSDETVTLTATVVLGESSKEVMFTLLVLQAEPEDIDYRDIITGFEVTESDTGIQVVTTFGNTQDERISTETIDAMVKTTSAVDEAKLYNIAIALNGADLGIHKVSGEALVTGTYLSTILGIESNLLSNETADAVHTWHIDFAALNEKLDLTFEFHVDQVAIHTVDISIGTEPTEPEDEEVIPPVTEPETGEETPPTTEPDVTEPETEVVPPVTEPTPDETEGEEVIPEELVEPETPESTEPEVTDTETVPEDETSAEPVEETPTEPETPEAPVEEAPVEEAPVEEAPVETPTEPVESTTPENETGTETVPTN